MFTSRHDNCSYFRCKDKNAKETGVFGRGERTEKVNILFLETVLYCRLDVRGAINSQEMLMRLPVKEKGQDMSTIFLEVLKNKKREVLWLGAPVRK